MKKCPYCAEQIQDEAIVCRYCGHSVYEGYIEPPAPAKKKSMQPLQIFLILAIIIFCIGATLIWYFAGGGWMYGSTGI